MIHRSRIGSVVLTFAALAAFPMAASALQVVNINAGANPAAGGLNLINALASITDNSAAKPYLITMDPGTYDVGDARVQMKSYVDLQGSGQAITIIQGNGNPVTPELINNVGEGSGDKAGLGMEDGVLRGANFMEIRNLQIKCVGGSGRSSIPLYNWAASPTLRGVTIVGSGGIANWGIRNEWFANHVGSSPRIEDSTITVSGGSWAYGMVNTGSSQAKPTILRTTISVSSATVSYGIYNDYVGQMAAELRDSKIIVQGSNRSYGYSLIYSSGGNVGVLTSTGISASGGTYANYGIYLEGIGGDSLTVDYAKIYAGGNGSNYGVYGLYYPSLTLRHSTVHGMTNSVFWLSPEPAKIGLTQLKGPVSDPYSAVTCAGVYDTNLAFYPGPTCP